MLTNAQLDHSDRPWNHVNPPDRANAEAVNEQVLVIQNDRKKNDRKSRRNLTPAERKRANEVRKARACEPCRRSHRKVHPFPLGSD